jgi:hypothetical protein
MKILLLTLACIVTGCADAGEEPLYWPCKTQSSIEINEDWGLRQIKVHHLCFNNELEKVVDSSSQSMLSVLDNDKRFSNKPVFFDVSQGKGAELKLHSFGGSRYLSWSYSSGTNSNSMKLYKLDEYVILKFIGELFSDEGSVVIDNIGDSLRFETKELDIDGKIHAKQYELKDNAIQGAK